MDVRVLRRRQLRGDMIPFVGVFLALLASFFQIGESISPVEVKGAKLFTVDDGNQFFIKGRLHDEGAHLAMLTLHTVQESRMPGLVAS